MNKVNELGLDETAISLAAFKASKVGDQLVVMTTDGSVAWFEIVERVAQRGRGFGTTYTFRDLATGAEVTETISGKLPEDVKCVRRVSAGVNLRTLKKVPEKPVAVAKVEQPEGEFENILDVPEEPEDSGAPVLETIDTEAQPEVESPAEPVKLVEEQAAEAVGEDLAVTG